MSRQRYPEEFKIEAVKQVTEKGKPVADVAQRLDMSVHSLYAWIKLYSKPQEQRQQDMTSKPSCVSFAPNSSV
jgi:transposase-like protein